MIFLRLFSRLQEVGTVLVSSLAFFNKALQINALPWFEVVETKGWFVPLCLLPSPELLDRSEFIIVLCVDSTWIPCPQECKVNLWKQQVLIL